MQIPVLIEPVAGNGFRARGVEPFALTAEGATRDEALERLREAIRAHMAAGAEIVPLELPQTEHPWAPFAGMFEDSDPLVQDWLQIMADRRRADEEQDAS